MLRIIADEREKPSGVPEALRSLGVSVEYRLLDVADYLVGAYAIERKSVRDFVSSLYSGRLFDQAHRLGEAYETIFLIVEGDLWEEIRGSRNPRSLWGALISSVLDFGLNTFFAPDEKQTAQFLVTLGRGVPGVGPRMAEELLGHFGSLRRVFAASLTEISVGAGLGKARALSLVRLLDAGYKGSKTVPSQASLSQE